jgi:DnaJ family protein A protein 5
MSFFFGSSADEGNDGDFSSKSKMRCHYEVIGVERGSSLDEIKKAYKKSALKWHPDRNFGKEEEASARFKEVTAAYNVLIDPHERKWYDDHREDILRGTDGSKSKSGKSTFEDNLDLWQYFNTSSYDGFDDNSEGFYAVYSHVFENLLAYENNEDQQEREPGGKKRGLVDYPPFGDSMSCDADTLRFYNQWGNFVTVLSFSWEDEYNPSEAENRNVRREIEKHNKKLRETGRRKYIDLVRALVAFMRKRDPRAATIDAAAKEKKQQEQDRRDKIKADELAKREAFREARANGELEEDPEEKERREREYSAAYLLADESSDEDEEAWAELGGGKGKRRKKGGKKGGGGRATVNAWPDSEDEEEGGNATMPRVDALSVSAAGAGGINSTDNEGKEEEEEEEEEEEDDEPYKCELCAKSFQSNAQLAQHLTSKSHRKAEKDAQKGSKKKSGGAGFVKRGA